MRLLCLFGALSLLSSLLVAQQPIPMGKMGDSPRTYRADDGSMLTKHSSDDDVAQAVRRTFDNDPELSNVAVKVKHHRVSLSGYVLTKDARQRAETMAQDTASVRSVNDHLKLGVAPPQTVSASAH